MYTVPFESPISIESLSAYWSQMVLETNIIVFFNLVGALFLGTLVGYERTWRGRAAGMRTYGLVCMASAALIVITGHPSSWFGGQNGIIPIDPTRVIQGLVTGIGFLGAGIIMKDGFTISGLTTAASIWAVTAIGVLVGSGFYMASILLTALSLAFMLWGPKLESMLPSRNVFAVTLRFRQGTSLPEGFVDNLFGNAGYQIAKSTLSLQSFRGQIEWRFIAYSTSRKNISTLDGLSRQLTSISLLENFQISHARN